MLESMPSTVECKKCGGKALITALPYVPMTEGYRSICLSCRDVVIVI